MRYAGLVLLLISSLLLGLELASRAKRSLLETEAVMALLADIRRSVFSFENLQEIFFRASKSERFSRLSFLPVITKHLKNLPPDKAMVQALEEAPVSENRLQKILLQLGEFLGRETADETAERLKQLEEEAGQLQKKLEKKAEESRRLYPTLSFLFGSLVVILLI